MVTGVSLGMLSGFPSPPSSSESEMLSNTRLGSLNSPETELMPDTSPGLIPLHTVMSLQTRSEVAVAATDTYCVALHQVRLLQTRSFMRDGATDSNSVDALHGGRMGVHSTGPPTIDGSRVINSPAAAHTSSRTQTLSVVAVGESA